MGADGLLSTDGVYDATKIAAWLGCLAFVHALGKGAWSWVLAHRDRPRIAKPEFCELDGHEAMKLSNIGKCALDIDSVRFECVDGNGKRRRIELESEEEGPIPAQRGIDRDDESPLWQKHYWLPNSSIHKAVESAYAVEDSDPTTWTITVWVRGKNRPIWRGAGNDLAGFHTATAAKRT